MELGQFDKAREFIQLDAGSEWANYVTPSLLLREGRLSEARDAVKRMSTSPHYHRDLMEAVLALRPPSELDRMAHDAESNGPQSPTLSFPTIRERFSHMPARKRPPFTCSGPQSTRTIARIPTCCLTPCCEVCTATKDLTSCCMRRTPVSKRFGQATPPRVADPAL